MNILNKLTVKNLQLNKKRTVVTIIGILLSVSLICAVAGMVSSLQATLIKDAITNGGNRHVTVENVTNDDIKYLINNPHVKSSYLVSNLGYAKLDHTTNKNKPYAYVEGYTKEAFANSTINLISGRLPQNDHEIIISKPFVSDTEYKLGDTITLDLGTRVCSDNSKLYQNNPYYIEEGEEDLCQETIINTTSKTYEIVGIMPRPNFNEEVYSAPGYTLITYSEEILDDTDVSLLFSEPSYYKEFMKNIKSDSHLKEYNYKPNQDLLRWSGVTLSDTTLNMLYAIASVVIVIIVLTSVFVIKNSFDISITEKTKQYGMLSSIGATSKQIKKSVLNEGFILGIIGIPLGICAGIFADFILVIVINHFTKYILDDVEFVFKVPLLPIVLSAILGIITIYFSIQKSARKMSKISPIQAIRNNNEIKLNKKSLKTPKIVSKIFGIGGQIAYKNLKRNKKRNRTTVISIVVSISVFISLSAFINYGFNLASHYYQELKYNVQTYMGVINSGSSEEKNMLEHVDDIIAFDNIDSYSITKRLVAQTDAKLYFTKQALDMIYGTSTNTETSFVVISLSADEYRRVLKENNIHLKNPDAALVVDHASNYDNGKTYTFNLLDLKNVTTISGKLDNGKSISLDIAGRIEKMPMGFESYYSNSPLLIVNEEVFNKLVDNNEYTLVGFFNSSNPDALEKDLNNYFTALNGIDVSVSNMYSEVQAEKSIIILISIFLYGFIIVISLIGITNIFNTLTTNMKLRSKELAMLKSIGMTNKEFNEMIRLESIFYSTKALIIGIPLGLIGSYFIYKAFASGNDFGYQLPLSAIIISILVVYLLVSVIMTLSLRKMKNQNIIDTIRDENN